MPKKLNYGFTTIAVTLNQRAKLKKLAGRKRFMYEVVEELLDMHIAHTMFKRKRRKDDDHLPQSDARRSD
jgi:hypothetical protein